MVHITEPLTDVSMHVLRLTVLLTAFASGASAECAPGEYSAQNSVCTPCPVGTYEYYGSCRSCRAGTFSDTPASIACENCGTGKYSDIDGNIDSANCILCVAGRYSTVMAATNIVSCIGCANGKYSSVVGSGSSSNCQNCDAGKYSGDVFATNRWILSDDPGMSCTQSCITNGMYCSDDDFPQGIKNMAAKAIFAHNSVDCINTWSANTQFTPYVSSDNVCYGYSTRSMCSSTTNSENTRVCPCRHFESVQFSELIMESSVVSVIGWNIVGIYEWRLGGVGQSCSAVCTGGGLSCSTQSGRFPQSISQVDTKRVYEKVGVTCTHETALDDSVAPYLQMSTGTCVRGTGESRCDGYADVQRLCPCSQAPVTVPVDFFLESHGVTSCELCGSGKYSATVGAVSDTACLSCGAGKYSGTVGAGIDSVCEDCRPGKFSEHTGASASDTCELCSSGKYSATFGAVSDTACLSCGAGKYLGTIGAGVDSLCLDCGAGKFSEHIGASASDTCELCGSGKYSATVGAVSDTACLSCGAGKYSGTVGTGVDSLCLDCGAGKFSEHIGASASDTCELCGSGKYSATVGAVSDTACLSCEAGKYSATVGAVSDTACLSCEAGKYSATVGAASDTACLSCEAGKYSATVGAVSDTACLSCGAGKYSGMVGAGIDSVCEDCGAGKFSEHTGASASDTCELCGSGKYSATFGAVSDTVCLSCGAGKYSATVGAVSDTACLSCGAGKYSATVGAVSDTACLSCGTGKYSGTVGAGVDSLCLDCGAGKFSEHTGASASDTCELCGSGKYSTIVGAVYDTACLRCGAGKFSSTPGATSCYSCDASKFSTSYGQTSETSCVPCSAGAQSTADRTGCTCRAGWSGSVGIEGNRWTGAALVCTECPADTHKIGPGPAACEACPAHSSARPGSTKSTDCICAAGWAAASDPIIRCVKCRADTYGPWGVSCVDCPAGLVSLAGSTSVAACVCPSGWVHVSGNDCEPCAAGTRSADGVCVSCADGSESLQGSSRCRQCIQWSVGMVNAAVSALARPGVSSDADFEALDTLLERHIIDTTKRAPISASCQALYQRVLKRQIANAPESRAAVAVNSAEASGVSTVVKLVIDIPLTMAEFTEDKQTSFRNAIAATADVANEFVEITDIKSIIRRRRMLSASISVATQITMQNGVIANTVSDTMTQSNINKQMVSNGISNVTVSVSPTVETVTVAIAVDGADSAVARPAPNRNTAALVALGVYAATLTVLAVF